MVEPMSKSKLDYRQINAEILSALDVVSEFKSFGVQVVGTQPNGVGWLSCRAFGREDKNPSAAINVKSGYYIDLGAEGGSMSLWDFAAQHGSHEDWKAARKHYAEKAGVDLGRTRSSKNPNDSITNRNTNPVLLGLWARNKPPITAESIVTAGGVKAVYKAKAGSRGTSAIALPIYGSQLVAEEPCGWVIFDSGGLPLPIFGKGGEPIGSVKMKTIAGSTSGLMNRDSLVKLAMGDGEKTIFKVEGVTDMLAMASIVPEDQRDTHLVICNSGGATENVRPEIATLFTGHRVFVIHDADSVGHAGAAKWLISLAPVAREVREVELPYEQTANRGKDLRDWIIEQQTAGKTNDEMFAELLKMAEAAPVHSAASAIPDVAAEDNGTDNSLLHTRIMEALQIDVLGERESGNIVMFAYHKSQRKTWEQRDPDRITYPRLIQIAGPPTEKFVSEGDDESHSKFSLSQVRNALCYLGGQKQIGDQTLVGVGCWQPLDDHGDDVPGVVAVGAGESAMWDGKTLERIAKPRAGGRLLKFSKSEPWYHFPQLQANLAACDQKWAADTIDRLIDIFGKWRWEHQDHAPVVVAGLVLASWVQSMWHWRPQISITGASEAGKSILFRTLGHIFNGLAIRSSKSSAAGVRQAIGTSAKIVLCDEFEEDKHRGDLLEMVRASSRGDEILRGTTGQRTKTFVFQHIFWVAAIEVALDRAPDRNRFITLELLRPKPEDEGKLVPPLPSELHDLGQRLLAIAVKNIVAARPLARRLQGEHIEGMDPRVIESYAVPAAIMAASTGMPDADAKGLLVQFLKTTVAEDQRVSDEEELIHDILRCEVRSKDGREILTVDRAIVNYSDPTSVEILGRYGMAVAYDGNTPRDLHDTTEGRYLFIDDQGIRNGLLRYTRWKGQDVRAILRRVPGASVTRRRIGNRRPRGVQIPMVVLEREYLVDLNSWEDG
jgi:hypothetical protein